MSSFDTWWESYSLSQAEENFNIGTARAAWAAWEAASRKPKALVTWVRSKKLRMPRPVLCEVLGLSASPYKGHLPRIRVRRLADNVELVVPISALSGLSVRDEKSFVDVTFEGGFSVNLGVRP